MLIRQILFATTSISVCVPLYITKRSEAVLQWGKRKNIKKMMINGELVIEWKKEKSIQCEDFDEDTGEKEYTMLWKQK